MTRKVRNALDVVIIDESLIQLYLDSHQNKGTQSPWGQAFGFHADSGCFCGRWNIFALSMYLTRGASSIQSDGTLVYVVKAVVVSICTLRNGS
jgi:hypothetical protein